MINGRPKVERMRLTFRQWLRTQQDRSDRIGDIARDVCAADRARTGPMPINPAPSYIELLKEIQDAGHTAAADALVAAHDEWAGRCHPLSAARPPSIRKTP
jgi:hypothetical protein